MATEIHQTPEWETRAPKKGIFSKLKFNHGTNSASTNTPDPSKESSAETIGTERGDVKPTFADKWLPNWLSCMGRSRTRFLGSIAVLVVLIILILGLGLGLGLTHKSWVNLNISHPGVLPHDRTYWSISQESNSIPPDQFLRPNFLSKNLLTPLPSRRKRLKNLPLPSNTGIFTGDLTYYSPGPGYGACGFENTSKDSICAVSHFLWDAVSTSSNPNNNPLCGKKIRITRYDATVGGNRSQDVEVVDRCVGCQATDLDLSLSVFDSLAEEAQGRVVGSWGWLN